ncbi:MAG TPA: hypothetical protein VMZ26_03355 [Pyrinomonadaceae bacterium]|nr:hypothetical protein [Pyrinomonadaceae bacterium]
MKSEFDIQKKRLIGYVICAAGFGVMLWAYYPGMMSGDSIASLGEGRSGIIYDQNSPVMSFLWGNLDRLVAGPGLMLALQLGIFWAAATVLWELAHRESLSLGLACVLFAFMPQILSQLPMIWKDLGMAVTLFLAVALVYRASKNGSVVALFLSPVFLFYGLAARLNALPAVLPIAIWTGFVACSVFGFGRRPLTSMAIGTAYCVALFVAVQIVQASITQGRTSFPFQFVLLHDLAAISLANNEPQFPAYIGENKNFSMERVRKNYRTTTVGELVYGGESAPGEPPVLAVTDEPNKIADLRAVWTQQVMQSPGAYLRHRFGVFTELIGLGRSVSFQYWDLNFSRNPPEFPIERNIAGTVLNGYFRLFRRPVMQTFFFRAFIWILACGYFFYHGLRSRLRGDWAFVFVLSASSLRYIFSYFFTAPAADFRYVYWPAIASAIVVIFGVYLLRIGKTGDAAQS